jgi:hypothetical protein
MWLVGDIPAAGTAIAGALEQVAPRLKRLRAQRGTTLTALSATQHNWHRCLALQLTISSVWSFKDPALSRTKLHRRSWVVECAVKPVASSTSLA